MSTSEDGNQGRNQIIVRLLIGFPQELQFILPIARTSFTWRVCHRISSPVRITDKAKENIEKNVIYYSDSESSKGNKPHNFIFIK